MLFDILYQPPNLLARVVPRPLVMDLATGPLDWLFIMHRQCVGSHNEFAADLQEVGNRNPKLPVLVTSHTVARILAGLDGCPQLCLSDVGCLTGLPDAQALGWHRPLRQACHV